MLSSLIRTKLKERNAGFTLIEILIIAPIVLIAISGFIALMITIVGKVLLTRDQSSVAYDAQNALNTIEQDTRLSGQFLTTTGTLPSPQGSDSNYTGTAAFTNTTNTLILNGLATDSNPRSATRALVYYDNQPNACGSTQSFNKIFTIRIIYFINNGTLWRRTYVPPWDMNSTPDANTVCTQGAGYTPWQQDSCSPGYSSPSCQTQDERIMDNITALTVNYYSTPSGTTDLGASGAASASTILVTITGGKTTAAHTFTSSASLRATRLDNVNT
jgi:hypothetical protein